MREAKASALPESGPLTRHAGSGGLAAAGQARGGARAPASVRQCALLQRQNARAARQPLTHAAAAAGGRSARSGHAGPRTTPPGYLPRAPPGGPRRGRARRRARRRPRPAPRAPPRRPDRPRRPGAQPSRAPGAPPRRPPRAPPPARCGLRTRARAGRHPTAQGQERRADARRLQACSPDTPPTSATVGAAACARAPRAQPAAQGRERGADASRLQVCSPDTPPTSATDGYGLQRL
jgi:hypothetical protein